MYEPTTSIDNVNSVDTEDLRRKREELYEEVKRLDSKDKKLFAQRIAILEGKVDPEPVFKHNHWRWKASLTGYPDALITGSQQKIVRQKLYEKLSNVGRSGDCYAEVSDHNGTYTVYKKLTWLELIELEKSGVDIYL